ncbi:hypothetical protein [Mesorhizobium sp. Z1-4]|uniref:hypothetical protein n=1 Tax=Mesorhizobium sp. Z1-4 TaxID=2448478 RepID=UPI000FDC1BA4|nr:hypothetical protein [Mesorhizobium sp. Z1-4]
MTEITDLSGTDASNTSAGGFSITDNLNTANIDDVMRVTFGMLGRQFAADTIASATTTDLSTKPAQAITVTGTTTITGLGTVKAGTIKFLTFSGALTLTHNGTSLILPGGANISTAAGDAAIVESLGSGNWRCLNYMLAADGPAGRILDVQSTTKVDVATFSSASTDNFTAFSGMTVSITPKRTTSKIWVIASVNVSQSGGGSVMTRLVRGSTAIGVGTASSNRLGVGAGTRPAATPYDHDAQNIVMQHLDSPSTTSAVTYGVEATAGSAYNVTVQLNSTKLDSDVSYGFRAASTITAIEISG